MGSRHRLGPVPWPQLEIAGMEEEGGAGESVKVDHTRLGLG